MSERKTIIRTVGLKKHYTVGGNTVRALDGVDMSVLQGEFVCVAGRSGSGKSTLLNMLAGLEPPTKGEIIVRGKHHLGHGRGVTDKVPPPLYRLSLSELQ